MQANYYSSVDTIYDNHGWTVNLGSPLEVSSTITFYGDGSDGSGTNIDGGDFGRGLANPVATEYDACALFDYGWRSHSERTTQHHR